MKNLYNYSGFLVDNAESSREGNREHDYPKTKNIFTAKYAKIAMRMATTHIGTTVLWL